MRVMSEARQRERVEGATQPPLIELAGVEKVYRMGTVDYRALRGVDLSIAGGEMVAVVGRRGAASRRS